MVAVSILGPIPFAPIPIANTDRTRDRANAQAGEAGTATLPAGWPCGMALARPVTCHVQCLAEHCNHRVDIPLTTLPQDQPWSRVGPAMLCSECGEPGRVNITPNWHDMDKLKSASGGTVCPVEKPQP